jgi:hypothetical protein
VAAQLISFDLVCVSLVAFGVTTRCDVEASCEPEAVEAFPSAESDECFFGKWSSIA